MEPFGSVPSEPAVDAITGWEDTSSAAVDADLTVDFATFYADARAGVRRALSLTLGDDDLATDATDEAFARAYLHWSSVSRMVNPGGWVYRVGLNWARSFLSRRRRGGTRRIYDPVSVEQPTTVEPAVRAALGALGVPQRSVVVCRVLFGWTEAETAAALGIRVGTVKSRLHRALAELQSRLAHLDPEARS